MSGWIRHCDTQVGNVKYTLRYWMETSYSLLAINAYINGANFHYKNVAWPNYYRSLVNKILDDKVLYVQLLSKIFIGIDFCHNYLHTLYLFECL